MDTGFHYEDTPPQAWLDELHTFDIPRLWHVQLNQTQRSNLLKRAKTQLTAWRKRLHEQLKHIQARYDKSAHQEAQQYLAPYRLLDSLGTDLNKQLRDLEQRMKARKAIPQGFAFGTRIFGDFATRRWQLGEQDDELRWDDYMAVERRYQHLEREYKTQAQQLKNLSQQVTEAQSDLDTIAARYRRRSGCLHIGLQLAVVLAAVTISAGFAVMVMTTPDPIITRMDNTAIAALLLVLALAGLITALVLYRRRQRHLIALETEIASLQTTIRQLKHEGARHKKQLLPTQQTVKEVQRDYQQLKASF